jgi:hypothetical protein
MNPWNRPTPIAFGGPHRLPSALDGIYFEASFRGTFRRGRTRHDDRQALARSDVLEAARQITQRWTADDIADAQDALNAHLGRPTDCVHGFYRQLAVRVELEVSADAAQAARQHREDRARIARLQYLQSVLYSDPTLLAIDHLDRNPEVDVDRQLIDRFHTLARELAHAKEWWAPLMIAWSQLAANTAGAPAKADKALEVLIAAIEALDARLIEHTPAAHALRGQ